MDFVIILSMQEFKVREIPYEKIPQRLKELPQVPKRLQLLGALPSFSEYKFLTVVGSRALSSYGRQTLDFLLEGLKNYKVCIVSGLALGADSLAHKKALEIGLPTIAVPGSGLSKEVLYPKSNYNLAHEILNLGGALLSEFDFKQKAAPWTFPQRNRIMAGLADAVLVIEAKEKSGTLITARLALEYNKDLLVLPAGIFDDTHAGNLKLLRQGAYPVSSAEDILEILGFDPKEKSQKLSLEALDLPQDELAILKVLEKPLEKDDLFQKSGLDATAFAIAFSKLELKGLIKEELGKVFKS